MRATLRGVWSPAPAAALGAATGLAILAAPALGQPLADPGFETGPILCEIAEQFAVWGADGGAIVGPTLGVAPLAGGGMLQFQATAPCCGRTGPATGTGGDVAQAVSLAPSRALIQSGVAVATFSAAFNRVAGDAQTDTDFLVSMRAFGADTLDGFRTGCVTTIPSLAQANARLTSDADPSTWERVEVTLDLPPATTFVWVVVSALENVRNDTVFGQEFDGHFADEAILTVRRSCTACPADFNCDGNLDADDLSDYITCFFTQAAFPGACPEADYNADANIDPDDLSDYITAFFAGCV